MTAPESTLITPAPADHMHFWDLESAHVTSQGRVLYLKCKCGTRRVDLVGDNPTLREELHTTPGAAKDASSAVEFHRD